VTRPARCRQTLLSANGRSLVPGPQPLTAQLPSAGSLTHHHDGICVSATIVTVVRFRPPAGPCAFDCRKYLSRQGYDSGRSLVPGPQPLTAQLPSAESLTHHHDGICVSATIVTVAESDFGRLPGPARSTVVSNCPGPGRAMILRCATICCPISAAGGSGRSTGASTR